MTIQYGVFFDMPEADYFAIPALSASGIKEMRVSPLNYWVNSPFNTGQAAPLFPSNKQIQEEQDARRKKSNPDGPPMTVGKGFDVRIISGRAAFEATFISEFVGDGTLLRSQADLKAACRDRGLPVGGNNADLIVRLIESGVPQEKIYDCCQRTYDQLHAGKLFLPAKWLSKIEIAAAMIEKDPVLSHAFTGGMPQVTIVWRCEKIGVDCKARLDYLKPKAIVDLKTFLNQRGWPIQQAVNREIVNRRYHVQAALYLEAAEQVAGFVNSGQCFTSNKVGPNLLAAFDANHPKTFLWVFQVKGVAPAALGRSLPAESMLLQSARAEIESAKQTYRECLEHYGPDTPWVTPAAIEPLNDDDYPPWMVD